MDTKTRKMLLALAREAIMNPENTGRLMERKIISRNAGVFVSVYVDDDLRGCIGSLEPIGLQKGIIEHALLAAYNDSRFEQIHEDEFQKMKIHINILSEPKPVGFSSPEALLKKLDKSKGYIISKGYRRATFLPSVWEQLPDKEEFLEHLCAKAGLRPDEWKAKGFNVEEYGSEEFSE